MAHKNNGHLTHDEAVRKLNELIKDIQVAMLTTVDDEGALRSRPMATQKPDFDGQLWFFTSGSSPKAREIEREHQVNISYADPDKNRYVSVSGTGQVVYDPAKNKELWTSAYKAWFPQGLDDPNLALLRVDVEKAEYWDSPGSAIVHALGFAKAENEKVKL